MTEGEEITGKYLMITMEGAGEKSVLSDGKNQVVKNIAKKKQKIIRKEH